MNFGKDSGAQLESILKRKVDSGVVKDFLNTQNGGFGDNNNSVSSVTRHRKH